MGYESAYKNAKQLLEMVHSGQAREESKAKAERARERVRQGLVRRRAESQQSTAPQDSFASGFLSNYMNMANVTPEEDPKGVTQVKATESVGAPVKGPVGAALEALAKIESAGSGGYKAVGPVVKTGMYKGQRAYGRYQVMESNIGPWSREVMGRPYTKEEWMENKDGVQDKVTASRMAASYHKYGTWEDAASVWFTGQPLSKGRNRSDGGLTGNQYVTKFRKYFVDPEPSNKGLVTSPMPVKRPSGFITRKD